jgi:hypothetical protein
LLERTWPFEIREKEMSRSGERSTSAASMIKRFREGKPTSKVEREAARGLDNNKADREMWWVNRDNSNTDDFEEPRLPPKAADKPVRVPHSEILERLRQPTDYMSIAAAKKFSADRSLNVDEMIEREIRGSLIYRST